MNHSDQDTGGGNSKDKHDSARPGWWKKFAASVTLLVGGGVGASYLFDSPAEQKAYEIFTAQEPTASAVEEPREKPRLKVVRPVLESVLLPVDDSKPEQKPEERLHVPKKPLHYTDQIIPAPTRAQTPYEIAVSQQSYRLDINGKLRIAEMPVMEIAKDKELFENMFMEAFQASNGMLRSMSSETGGRVLHTIYLQTQEEIVLNAHARQHGMISSDRYITPDEIGPFLEKMDIDQIDTLADEIVAANNDPALRAIILRKALPEMQAQLAYHRHEQGRGR